MAGAHSKILIVDDEPAILRIVTAALHISGYTDVVTAFSVSTALQAWREQDGGFDLLLTDFSLPDGSAASYVPELLRANPNLRVVFMTGYCTDALDLSQDLAQKIVILEKPFRAGELQELVQSQLAERALT